MGEHGWAAPGETERDEPSGALHSARLTWPPARMGHRSPTDGDEPQRASRARPWRLLGLAIAGCLAVVIGAAALVTELVGGVDSTEDRDTWDRGYTVFVDPAGEFELSLPAWYAPVSTRGDVAGAGTHGFPSDPESAEALDQVIARQPGSVVLLVTDGPSFQGEFRMSITLERLDGDAGDLDEANGGRALAPAGVELEGDPLVVELAAGNALRVEYRDAREDRELVRWYLPDGDATWILTFRAVDLAEYGGHVDVVAESFDLLEPEAPPQAEAPPGNATIRRGRGNSLAIGRGDEHPDPCPPPAASRPRREPRLDHEEVPTTMIPLRELANATRRPARPLCGEANRVSFTAH